jgi:hypothetical protein
LFDQVFGVANADCAGRQEGCGRLRVTTGIGDWDGEPAFRTRESLLPSVAQAMDLAARVGAILPALAGLRFDQIWGGPIDLTPDDLPLMDRAGPEGSSSPPDFQATASASRRRRARSCTTLRSARRRASISPPSAPAASALHGRSCRPSQLLRVCGVEEGGERALSAPPGQ